MKYQYRFKHNKLQDTTIRFNANSDQEAFIKLGSIVQKVMDWDFRKFKNK